MRNESIEERLNLIRTNAYNYISALFFVAGVVGSTVVSLLLSNHVYVLNSLSITCFLFTACVACSIPAYYGIEDPGEHDMEPFSDSDDDFPPTAAPPRATRLPRSTLKARLLSVYNLFSS